MLEAFNKIIEQSLSVRKTEDMSRSQVNPASSTPIALSRYEKRIQSDLSYKMQAKVKINKSNKGNGKIVIPFKTEDDLNRILNLLEK